MKYQLKSGKVFVRMCNGLINALENGDTLILSGDKCDFSIAIENSCIYTNVIYNERYNKLDSVLKYALLSCNTVFYQGDFNSLKQAKNVLVALTLKAEEKAVEKAKNTDIAHVSDDVLTCMLNNEIEYINNELIEVCLYDKMNGGSGCVVLGCNEWIDVTTATQEYIKRFGVYFFFEYLESLLYFTTHVSYNCTGNIYTDYLNDCMYIEEVTQYDEYGNIIEYYETENFKIQLQVVKQEKALKNKKYKEMKIKSIRLSCFIYLVTSAIALFLQNFRKIPQDTNDFILGYTVNILGIEFNTQVINGRIIFIALGRFGFLVTNIYNVYDTVLDVYKCFCEYYSYFTWGYIKLIKKLYKNNEYIQNKKIHDLVFKMNGTYQEKIEKGV